MLNLTRRKFLVSVGILTILGACGSETNAPTVPVTVKELVPTVSPTPSSTATLPVSPTVLIFTPTPSSTATPFVSPTPSSTATSTVKPTPPLNPQATANNVPEGYVAVGKLENFKVAALVPVAFKVGQIEGFIAERAGIFLAFSDICTHSGCQVKYSAAENLLNCPCHGSQFDQEGFVVHGPARVRLPLFPTLIVGDTLYLKL